MDDNMDPMDVTKLRKGDYIPPAVCEELTGTKRQDRRYGLALLSLKQRLYDACESMGVALSFSSHKDGIRVHTDDEASAYHHRESLLGVQRIYKAAKNMANLVDRAGLSDTMKPVHDRNMAVMAMRIQAMRGVNRALAREAKKIETEGTK